MNDKIESKVKELIIETLLCPREKVVGTASLEKDLNADSLDRLELVIFIEGEFEIEISDDEAEKLTTVQNIIDLVAAKTA